MINLCNTFYRQVKEWARYRLDTNDKNLSNWVIRAAHDWLLPIYERLKHLMMAKSVLHVDETYGQIINRSDGKSGQSNAYNWVYEVCPVKVQQFSCFKVHYHVLGLFLKASLKIIPER
jgi:hypothetical protein